LLSSVTAFSLYFRVAVFEIHFGGEEKMRGLFLTIALSAVTPAIGWAKAPRWDAVKQFSFRQNPHGAWSYATNALPVKPDKAYCLPGVKGWFTYQPIPNALGIVRNYTGATADCATIQAPTDHLWMDPEGGAVIVTWTAPQSGNFKITGDFLGIDTGENSHPVSITGPSGSLFSGTIASFGQTAPFKVNVMLTAGQQVAFTVANGGTPNNLSTGLKAVITGD